MSTEMPPIPTSAAAIVAVPADLVPSVAPKALTPAPAQMIAIPIDQLNAFTAMQSRLVKVEEEQQLRDEAARTETIKALAAKGQVEEALRTQREQAERDLAAVRLRLSQTEERAKRYALDGELARTLASQPLVTGGAEQLTELWRNKFVVEPQSDTFTVRTQDFQNVGVFIAAQLGRPEYAHFLRPVNPAGGSGASAASQSAQTAPAQSAVGDQPRNLGDAIALKMAGIARQQQKDAHLSGGASINAEGVISREAAAGFGLRPLGRQA